MELDPNAVSAGARLIVHETIDSTNAEALRLARAGERGPLWIVAKYQSAGRGRRGRTWVSEPGNLYASLLLTDPAPPDRLAELSLVAAVALHDAATIDVALHANRLTLKWPNDLLIDGLKVAGILTEGEGRSVVIGIGVNCSVHPSGTDYPATDLATAGIRVTPDRLFATLSAAMTDRLAQWDCGSDFPAIRVAWLHRAAHLGKPIRIKTVDGELQGRFDGIDDTGCLLLCNDDDGARQVIAAGDVMSVAR